MATGSKSGSMVSFKNSRWGVLPLSAVRCSADDEYPQGGHPGAAHFKGNCVGLQDAEDAEDFVPGISARNKIFKIGDVERLLNEEAENVTAEN